MERRPLTKAASVPARFCNSVPKALAMFDFSGPRLAVTKRLIVQCPKISIVGIMHALSDTYEFLTHLHAGQHEVKVLFAKPYSKNMQVIASIEQLGIRVEQLDYDLLENTSLLRDTLTHAHQSNATLIVIDVGGYFAKSLAEMTLATPETLPLGVVEVTTFGHKRYADQIAQIGVPVVSVARSPIKEVEASFVGESAWFAVDNILRDVGMSAFGRHVGIVGYGMIGRRVAAAAKSNGAHTHVFDIDPLKLLDARSFKHDINFNVASLLQDSEIVVSSTGETAIPLHEIQNARDGIILASAGSKMHEVDVGGLTAMATSVHRISEFLVEYLMPSGKRVYLLRDGAAVNFLLGSCPDQTMDLVFAEITEGCRAIVECNLVPGIIHEVSTE